MKLTHETLLAYADGLLEESEAAEVAALLKDDAEARETLRLIELSGKALAEARTAVDAEDAPVPGGDALERLVRDPAREHVAVLQPKPPRESRPSAFWPMAAGIALLAVGLSAGLFISSTLLTPKTGDEGVPAWVMSVADYQGLYGRAAVEIARTSDAERAALQAQITEAMLKQETLPIPDLAAIGYEFRRGQVLEYDGWPLVQLVYLPEGDGLPVSVCLKRFREDGKARHYYMVHDIGIVQWAGNGLEFLVVGDTSEEELGKVAEATAQQFRENL